MKKQLMINLLIVLIALSPVVYLALVWESIPQTFSTRFEFENSFEKVESRNSLLIASIVLSSVSVILYLLMRNLKRFDPNVNASTPKGAFNKMGLIITLFLVIINYFLILSAKNEWIINTETAIIFFGFMIMGMGNYMNNLKPNYIAGIRLPWTLKDPDNWRKTHQLAGKLWFAGGIVLIILSLLTPKPMLMPSLIGLLLVLVLIPGVYSYRIYRSKLHEH